jgi:hypothetical protein
MSEPRPIYRSDGKWMALVHEGNLFNTMGEWLGWLDGSDVYTRDGEYAGYISNDGRLLCQRVLPYRKRRRPPEAPPRIRPPETIPLPPMFKVLSFSTIDVFEEEPSLFNLVGELRSDAGEMPLRRLIKTDPRLAVRGALRQVEQELLEEMVHGIIYGYGATEPPVPIEPMAAGLPPRSATEVETKPPRERLQLAQRMIERLGHSSWAMERGYCGPEGFTKAQIEYAARALLLPRRWLLKTPRTSHCASKLAESYAVPEETVLLRIHDLE